MKKTYTCSLCGKVLSHAEAHTHWLKKECPVSIRRPK